MAIRSGRCRLYSPAAAVRPASGGRPGRHHSGVPFAWERRPAVSVPSRLLAALLLIGLVLALRPSLSSTLAAPAADSQAGGAGELASVLDVVPPLLPERFSPLPPEDRPGDAAAIDAWVDRVVERLASQEDPFAVVDACVEQEMAETETPGASIAIAIDGELRYVRGYGVKHRENGGEIDAATRFRIGSTTKQLTAAAVMQLVEAGQLDLHEPVTTYRPDLKLAAPWQASSITLHHLLTHSAGLPDVYALSLEEFAQLSLDSWASGVLPDTPLNAPPGTFWNYSNPNFSLAGLVVETVSGELYRDYVAQHLFAPLGMTRSTFDPREALDDGNFAYGHQGSARMTPLDFDLPAIEPAGSAMSTPSDMVRWALALMNGGGGVLGADSAAALQAPQINTGYVSWEHYGYGIFVTEFEDTTDPGRPVMVYDHGGNVWGYSSQLYWVPERRFVVSILANTMTSLAGSAHCALRELAHVQRHSYAGQASSPETWGPFEGTYAFVNAAYMDITGRVSLEDSKLVLRYLDFGDTLSLLPILKDTFAVDADGDGKPEQGIDFTFIRHPEDPERVDWLRYRMMVGERVGQFPAAIQLSGDGCAPFLFTAERDMPELTVRASGLAAGPETLTSLPIEATDPNDPTTASYKQTLVLEGETTMFFVLVIPETDDNLELYLMYDADDDGRFDWPRELRAAGLVASDNQRLLYLGGRPSPGRYQLWVHGTVVNGPSTFALMNYIVSGQQLTVRDAPQAAAAGSSHKFEVCAHNTQELTGQRVGFVELDYHWPPRRVRVPVIWVPAGGPTPTTMPTPEPTAIPVYRALLPVALRDSVAGQTAP